MSELEQGARELVALYMKFGPGRQREEDRPALIHFAEWMLLQGMRDENDQ